MPATRTTPPPRGIALLLAALSSLGPFAIDTYLPSFHDIGASLAATPIEVQQTLTAYLLPFALMTLWHGAIADALGRRRVILVALALFALATAGCALATRIEVLWLLRALQGVSAGAGVVVSRAIVRDLYDGPPAQRLMAQISMMFALAPAVAPVIGGWLLGWQRWPGIFWFLAVFGVGLVAVVWRGLPETHPPQARLPLEAGPLLRGYAGILGRPRFLRLTLAGALNFGALFLYIASAPAFVIDQLGLGERDFGWFFIPMIGGMMIGAFVSGRAAGRIDGQRLANIGFACCGAATLVNIGYNLLVVDHALPWAVLPISLNAFGIALVFPIVTLAILDMYPYQRGSASSLQAFVGLLVNVVIAGMLSPWLSHDGLSLALGAACFTLAGWLFWRWENLATRRTLRVPKSPAGMEPTEL